MYRIFFVFVIVLCIASAQPRPVAAEKNSFDPKRLGFFYDSRTNRYFSSEKARFTLQPVGDPRFVERIELSVDGEDFESYEGKLSFDEEGSHRIRFRAVDPVLNWSPIQDFRVHIDLTPPQTRPLWQGPKTENDEKIYVSPKSVLSAISQDRLSGVNGTFWKQDGRVKPFPKSSRFQSEGEVEISYRAIDNVGNEEDWKELQFWVDATAPATKAEIEGESFQTRSGKFVGSGARILLTPKDSLSGVTKTEYQINNGPVTPYLQPISVNESQFLLKYRSIDGVGNTEKWNSLKVYQDNEPPTLAQKQIGKHVKFGGKLFAKPGFAISTSAKDSASGLKELLVSRNEGSFKPAENQMTFQEPGEYYLRFMAVDQVGNQQEANPTTVVIDTNAPKTELISSRNFVEKDGIFLTAIPNQLKFLAQDKGVGVARTELSYDGKNFRPITADIDLSEWKEKRRTLYYRSIDRLGNIEPTQKLELVVRTTGPTVDLFVESENLPNLPLSTLRQKLTKEEKKAIRKPAKASKKVIKKKSKKKKLKKNKRKPASKKKSKKFKRKKKSKKKGKKK